MVSAAPSPLLGRRRAAVAVVVGMVGRRRPASRRRGALRPVRAGMLHYFFEADVYSRSFSYSPIISYDISKSKSEVPILQLQFMMHKMCHCHCESIY